MKKLYCFLGLFIFLCTSLSVAAEVIDYQPNVFTDETTIEEDFKNLNMDINNYYQPSYRYGKWYVVAMSEAYVDTESFDIQTYFYIYNPSSPKNYEYWYQDNDDVGEEHFNEIDSFLLDYKISGNQKSGVSDVLSINYDHHIYKVKGFTYSYTDKAEIEVNKIQNYMTIGPGFISESTFKSTCQHSKLNGFSVELYFNSTLIIDDYIVVMQDIEPQSNFWNFWEEYKETFIHFGGEFDRCSLRFYNFNFPKSIRPDSIEYAKFSYDTIQYYKDINDHVKELSKEYDVIHEYKPGSHEIQVGSYSSTLEFQTFVLGNRIDKGEFGYIEFSDEDKKKFNYDCSILLDILPTEIKTHRKKSDLGIWYTVSEKWYREIDNVDFLELQYKKEGVNYNCQIVSKPVEKEDFVNGGGKPRVEKSWWDKFLELLVKMFDFIFYDFFHLKFWIPDIAKQIISGIILFVGVFFVIPKIIKWIIKLFKALLGR